MALHQLVLRNNVAVAAWIFMGIWMAMLCLITYLVIRDGGMPGIDGLASLGVIALFWLFGMGGCAYFFAMPCVTLAIGGNEVRVRERFLLRSQTEIFPVANLAPLEVLETKDSEGDVYFQCTLVTPGGRKVTVSESNQKSVVEAARDRVVAFIA